MERPAAKSMALVRRPTDGSYLVCASLEGQRLAFERPLGGHIELGESAVEAAVREIREEINEPLHNARLLGVLENMFTLDGQLGHEIVFVVEAEFADPASYEIDQWPILDEPPGYAWAKWRSPTKTSPRLVPDGIGRFMSPGLI